MSSLHSALESNSLSNSVASYADYAGSRSPNAAMSLVLTQTNARDIGQLTAQSKLILERIRMEERCKERARIVRELHDTLLHGFVGASMLLHQAAEQAPADSPSKPALCRALDLVYRAIDEGRAAMRGLRSASPAPSSLEQAFSKFLSEVITDGGPQLRTFVQGRPRPLGPVMEHQLFLIGREALMNALRHSKATKIEVELQYLGDHVRLFVHDNGCGINPETVQSKSDSHWGLRGMRDRAENIGARFEIRSRSARGTEVGIVIPTDGAGY